MGPMSSTTYIYAYIAFAVVYLASAAACAIAGFRASTRLSRCAQQPGPTDTAEPPERAIARAFRLLDWVQGTALLAIAHVVVSVELGYLILTGQPASVVNLVWVALNAVVAGAAIVLAVLGMREVTALADTEVACGPDDRTAQDLQRISNRLGASAVVVLLLGAYVAVNLVSIIADLGTLLKTDFLL
ncbi:MAG: hypothetical protein QMD76_05260 [Anaerosomatales bacterium]|nr:hypothetical protein [Anaerosomatales bacterium]